MGKTGHDSLCLLLTGFRTVFFAGGVETLWDIALFPDRAPGNEAIWDSKLKHIKQMENEACLF